MSMLNFHSSTVYVRQEARLMVVLEEICKTVQYCGYLWICCRLLGRLDIVHVSHYVTLCHTMSDPLSNLSNLSTSSIFQQHTTTIYNYDIHPSTDFQDGRHAVLGGDQLWLIDLWRPWPEEQEAPIFLFDSWLLL